MANIKTLIITFILVFFSASSLAFIATDCPPQTDVRSDRLKQLIGIYHEIPPEQGCPVISRENFQTKFDEIIKNRKSCGESVTVQDANNEFFLIKVNKSQGISQIDICNRCQVQKIQDKSSQTLTFSETNGRLEAFQKLAERFISSIQTGAKETYPSFQNAYHVQKLIEQIHQKL